MFFFQIENSNRSKVVVLVAVAQDRCGRVVVVGVELKFVWQWLMEQKNSFTSHYFLKKFTSLCFNLKFIKVTNRTTDQMPNTSGDPFAQNEFNAATVLGSGNVGF